MEDFSINCITPNLLLNQPRVYLEHLNYCIYNNIEMKEQINLKIYETWYSNHLMCLSYLVGDHKDQNISNTSCNFYGFNKSIDENLGIDILSALVVLGVDIYSKNYYGDDVFASLNRENVLSERINNKKFKNAVFNLKRCSSP